MKHVLFRIKYPRLVFLVGTFVIAYFIFVNRDFGIVGDFIFEAGYLGVFFAGFFYSYAFTAAPGLALLLLLANDGNIFLSGVIGGFGALAGNFVFYFFLRNSFKKEISKLSKERVVLEFEKEEMRLLKHYHKYFVASFAGLLIASPLPSEFGVLMLASARRFSTRKFALISLILNTLGIFIILLIGRAI